MKNEKQIKLGSLVKGYGERLTKRRVGIVINRSQDLVGLRLLLSRDGADLLYRIHWSDGSKNWYSSKHLEVVA